MLRYMLYLDVNIQLIHKVKWFRAYILYNEMYTHFASWNVLSYKSLQEFQWSCKLLYRTIAISIPEQFHTSEADST